MCLLQIRRPSELLLQISAGDVVPSILNKCVSSERRLSEQPLPKERALMPTFPDKEGGSTAARRSRQLRLQPSPDPRVAAAGSLAARAAQIASAFAKP